MDRAFVRLIQYVAGGKLKSGFVLQRAMFKVMGMFWWEKPSLTKRIYSISFVLIQIISVVTVTSFIINTKITTAEDFTQVINSLIVSVSFIVGIMKVLCMHFSSRDFARMIEFLEDLPPDDVVWPAREKIIMYSVCSMTTIGGWLIYGIVTKGWPWDADFPWDKTTQVGHILGISLQVISSLPGGLTHLMIDSILYASVEKLRPHINRLKYTFSRIGPCLEKNKALMRDAVKLHIAIQRSVYLINTAFSRMFMLQVISLVPLICINAFVITQIDDTRYILTSVLPMSLTLCMEIFMLFGAGQLLASEMEHMDRVCYDNGWYAAPLHSRKELSIAIECSRKDLTINAYGVTYANYATLLADMKNFGQSKNLFLHDGKTVEVVTSNKATNVKPLQKLLE